MATTGHIPSKTLVAVVDLEQKKIVKIEEGPVVPVPMTARPFDGRDRVAPAVKPMQIIEPEGKKLHHYWRYDSLAELGFSPQHELARRTYDLHRDL